MRHLLLITLLLTFVPAQAAMAETPLIRDCSDDGVLDGKYTRAQLQAGLSDSQRGDLIYTECQDAIQAALGAGGKGPGAVTDGTGAGGKLTPAERRVAEKRRRARAQERRQIASLNDDLAGDGSGGLVVDDASSDGMPLPMLLLLVALACAAVGGGLWYAAQRNPAVANALRRVPLPRRRN
jgi:hypothetical protein